MSSLQGCIFQPHTEKLKPWFRTYPLCPRRVVSHESLGS